MIFTFSDEFGFGGGESHQSRQNREGVMDFLACGIHSPTVPDQIQPQSTTNHNFTY